MSASQLQPTVVRFPTDVYNQLKARSEQEDRTMAAVVRRAVKRYLASEE